MLVDNELYYSRDDNFEATIEKDGRLVKMRPKKKKKKVDCSKGRENSQDREEDGKEDDAANEIP